ncbi:MAG TPA: POTRA domain-containing protein [Verrucomicrobiae bacterium]|nr:POTRA domain-containing protein [Verrucomicrobiae bacterium]
MTFNVQSYVVHGGAALSRDTINSVVSKFTGTNVSLTELASAAAAVQAAYWNAGYTNLSVAIPSERATNGVVTMNLFRAAVPQILISGRPFTNTIGALALARGSATPGGTAAAKTNAPPGFPVKGYEITGDTLLSTNTLMSIFAKRTGTNITVNDIVQAASDLQNEYRDRGYPTVAVSVPQQQITNGYVKIRVFEGKLADILVTKNHYFSSNNVMRALPSLHTNIILHGPVFQAELDRANQNQDRQIYGEMAPGPTSSTTDLILNVKDRLPLHAKVELNNQSSPGTPELRVNSSATYNNLWQLEHSIGVQYSFSPETYKPKDAWDFYDLPLVANYSAFYRMPLSTAEAVENSISVAPGNFGYDEATRKFRLPPSSGRPELNLYASRSTIDTGLEQFPAEQIYNVPGVRQVFRQDVQDDVTVNNALGFRLTAPLPQVSGWRSTLSGGFDFKTYDLNSSKTNVFKFTEITINSFGQPNPPVISSVFSPVPTTTRSVQYLPFSIRWDGSHPDKYGTTILGVGYSPNFFGGRLSDPGAFQNVAGSTKANGYYQIVTPSLTRDQILYRDWHLLARVDGQWANQPLISNEQFGIGGLNGVRGYREGEIFSDTGWRITSEIKTPPHILGTVYGKTPLIVRGSIFMDYAQGYLVDPNGRLGHTSLWGTGFGAVASISPHWDARFLFSWPLNSTPLTEAGQPRFDFGLSFQF